MRKLLETDGIEEPVKKFLSGLDISTEPTVLEVNGRRVYILVRPTSDCNNVAEPWTMEKNQRRYDLIDKQIDRTIVIEEAVELTELQMAFDQWIDSTAPLPVERVRQLHDQLLAKMLTKNSASVTG